MSDVVLSGFPVELFGRALEHQAALRRELDVIRLGGEEREGVPDHFATLLEELRGSFSGYAAAMDILSAVVAGEGNGVDVVIPVPDDDDGAVAEGIARLRDLMHEVDAYCRAGGRLLTVATPEDLVALREWFLGEIVDQLRGARPTTWSDFQPPRRADDAIDGTAPSARIASSLPEGWAIDQSGREVVVSVNGALDLESASAFRDALHELEAEGKSSVTVNLRRVGFVDSVGLSVLVAAHTRLSEHGGRLTLILPTRLQRLFEIAGLLDVLNVAVDQND